MCPCSGSPWDAEPWCGGELGKQPPLCTGDSQNGKGGGLGAAVPVAHSASLTRVREFNSQHTNHLEQPAKVFVSLPFTFFPCPNNRPLSTLGIVAIFLQKAGGT